MAITSNEKLDQIIELAIKTGDARRRHHEVERRLERIECQLRDDVRMHDFPGDEYWLRERLKEAENEQVSSTEYVKTCNDKLLRAVVGFTSGEPA